MRNGLYKDLTGRRFGRWTVISRAGLRTKSSAWNCRCDCGTKRIVLWASLKQGSKSCGCLVKEFGLIHGAYGTPTYKTWRSMIRRCTDSSDRSYERYGAKGVKVCKRWQTFKNFLADMGEKPERDCRMTIDRIDNSRGYEPGNCRWTTYIEQSNNRSYAVRITFCGRTQTRAEWARELGISRSAIKDRLDRYGWSVERAFTTPTRKWWPGHVSG